jgi:hypothetical protein
LYQLPRLRGVDGPAGGFAQLHSPIALDFLDRYPTPQSATQLTAARIEGFCRRRGYSGRRSGAELLHRLRSAPVSASRLGEVVVAQLIRTQVGVVRALTIESTFATVRLRTKVTKGPGSRAAGIAMAYKLIDAAQARWRAVNAPHLVALVRAGAVFHKGKLLERPTDITPPEPTESTGTEVA